jgi:hypothetical protein
VFPANFIGDVRRSVSLFLSLNLDFESTCSTQTFPRSVTFDLHVAGDTRIWYLDVVEMQSWHVLESGGQGTKIDGVGHGCSPPTSVPSV